MVEISPVPSFMSKTHVSTNGLGARIPVTLSALLESQEEGMGDDDQLLCPIRTSEAYVKRSSEYRSADQERLIISYRRGTIRDNFWIHQRGNIIGLLECVSGKHSLPSTCETALCETCCDVVESVK